jgi:PAS domain S-box-containing protein
MVRTLTLNQSPDAAATTTPAITSTAPLQPSALRLAEEHWSRIQQAAGVGAFELNLVTNALVVTPHVATLFGLDLNAAAMTLADCERAILAEDLATWRDALASARTHGVLDCTVRAGHAEGGVRWLAISGSKVPDDGNTLRCTCLDVTRQKELELQLFELGEAVEARVRARAQELEASYISLHESERRFRLLVEAVTDYAIFMLDPAGNVVNWNPGAERLKGYTAAEILGQHFSRFYTDEDRAAELPWRFLDQAATHGKFEGEGWRVRKDGSRFWANVVIHAIREAGQLLGFAKVTRDLTERRQAEEQLRQAQKMEAIGQLTGGIAHDFNNLLTVISGNLETLQRRLRARAEDGLDRYVASALQGASRAALLTNQLLAFSRRQPLEPATISVNALVTRTAELLRRTLPEAIAMETVLAAGVWNTFVDANQLENTLLNLAVNARDAMPDGGRLTIEAANTYLDARYAALADVPPGQYVGVFVSDTGTGMTPDTVARAFEPFFTTKEFGRGTGLGLSQVYGFVRQSGGHVKIYSEPGAGTTVKIYLPRQHGEGARDEAAAAATPAPRGEGETILVVEDQPEVRGFVIGLMRELNYQVLDASDAAGALLLLESRPDITLLFTDVGLPGGMNGRQLADAAVARRPDLKVLFTSGYARNAIVHHGRLDPGVQLITKPFTFAGLAVKLRQVLDGA